MNDQTKIIVGTAVVLVGIDLAVRAFLPPKVVYVGQTRDVVTAREFRLTDDNGRLRAHLFTDQQGEPGLVLYDRMERPRAQLDTWDTIPSLILYSPDGQRSSYFGMDDLGKSMIHMYDPHRPNFPTAAMSVSEELGIPGFLYQRGRKDD
jgi:hypothetical protein